MLPSIIGCLSHALLSVLSCVMIYVTFHNKVPFPHLLERTNPCNDICYPSIVRYLSHAFTGTFLSAGSFPCPPVWLVPSDFPCISQSPSLHLSHASLFNI